MEVISERTIRCPTWVGIKKISEMTGISQYQIRAWCTRQYNPMPHQNCGKKIMIRPEAAIEFILREETQ